VKPSTHLFLVKLIVDHRLEHGGANDLEELHQMCSTALAHTPTFIELMYLNVKVLKRMHRFAECETIATQMKDFDLNDRWGNNVSAQYML